MPERAERCNADHTGIYDRIFAFGSMDRSLHTAYPGYGLCTRISRWNRMAYLFQSRRGYCNKFAYLCCYTMLIFRHLYGGSDCLAYILCAMYLAGCGKDLTDYLLFMLLAVGLELIVQVKNNNINIKEGKLKQPKALIPYIAAAMLVWRLIVG